MTLSQIDKLKSIGWRFSRKTWIDYHRKEEMEAWNVKSPRLNEWFEIRQSPEKVVYEALLATEHAWLYHEAFEKNADKIKKQFIAALKKSPKAKQVTLTIKL